MYINARLTDYDIHRSLHNAPSGSSSSHPYGYYPPAPLPFGYPGATPPYGVPPNHQAVMPTGPGIPIHVRVAHAPIPPLTNFSSDHDHGDGYRRHSSNTDVAGHMSLGSANSGVSHLSLGLQASYAAAPGYAPPPHPLTQSNLAAAHLPRYQHPGYAHAPPAVNNRAATTSRRSQDSHWSSRLHVMSDLEPSATACMRCPDCGAVIPTSNKTHHNDVCTNKQ